VKVTGAKVLLECLKEFDVDTIFGYPGGAVIPIYDAIFDEKEITHVLTAHEQGATHAADGYARATGKVGVVIATSGPGATNTVTGIATAYSDSIPLVIITGQVARDLIGRDSFQEVNITDITSVITKKNYKVKNVECLPGTIREAFKVATSGRPGPVLIDIPKDVQTSLFDYEPLKNETVQADDKSSSPIVDCREAIDAINNCKKPVIYAGGGVCISGASHELLEFAEKLKAPVTCSLMGLGSFPGNHPYFTGMVGMHGTHCSNFAVTNCDLLIAVGARFSDRVASDRNSFAANAKVIHIDIDPREFGKNVSAEIPLCGDVKEILINLNKSVNTKKLSSWNIQIDQWMQEYPERYTNGGLSPQVVLKKLNELTDEDTIITTEVGQHQIWTAQYFKFNKPRTLISSGGMGTMGFGLGAAIGASFGCKNSRIINIAGDGSFKMNSTELATVARYNLPVIQIVFNNHALGMVRQWQDMFCKGRLSFTGYEEDVNFVKLADAYGIKGIKVTNEDEVEEAMTYALSLKEPVLIECVIDEQDKVFPMVAPGAPIDKIISC